MKKGILVICLMVLIASTAVVMAKNGDPLVMIEGSKVMFFKFVSETPNTYKIELKGPTYSEYNPDQVNTYTGEISRETDSGKAQLFAVAFYGEDTPPVELITNYYSETSGTWIPFELYDAFDATVWVCDYNYENCIDPVTGKIEILPETEE